MLLFPPIYRKVIFLFSCLILVTAIIWAVSAVVYSRLVPEKLSLLVIAYTLGLRHGLDADHIAAIDNVTRRMVQIPDNLSLAKHHNEIPVTIGLMFSLGHSTMVVVASIVIAVASTHIIEGAGITGIVGTCISATFLILKNPSSRQYFFLHHQQTMENVLRWTIICNHFGYSHGNRSTWHCSSSRFTRSINMDYSLFAIALHLRYGSHR